MISLNLESYWIEKREKWMNDMLLQLFNDILSISIKALPFIFVLLLVTVLFQKKVNPLIIEGIWFLVFVRLIIPTSLPIQLNTIQTEKIDSKSILVESFSDNYVDTGTTALRLKSQNDNNNVSTIPIEKISNVKEELEVTTFPSKYILPIIWFIGCLFFLVRAFYKANTFRKIITRDSELNIVKSSSIQVLETPFVEYPIIFGCINPQIYVPKKLWSTLSEKERKYILLHEMGHYKRKDILTGWLCYFVLAIHWFNPMVWLSFLVIQDLKEIACDRYVITKLPVEESIAYARTLLSVSESGCSNYSNLSAAGMAGKSTIKRRIEMIVNNKKKKVIWSFVTLVIIITVILMFLTDPFSDTSFVIPVQSQQELLADMDTIVKAIEFKGSVLIAHNSGIILNKSYGMADNDKKILNTPQTRFHIASLSKQFTAMAILVLYAQKKIDLQDRISKYIPDCPVAWQYITIHHLLTHTSGIQDDMNIVNIDQLKKTSLKFQPGTEWDYSNIGYNLLGYIIEQSANQTFETFLQENIFTPLNMDNTGYGNNQINQAVGYTIGFIKADVVDWSQLYYTSAAGGLYSTTEDLYIWNQALLTNKLVSKNLIKKMFTSYVPTIWSKDMGYGYGWFVGQRFNHRVVEHSGSLPGFSTYNGLYPDDDIHIIALSNQWDSSMYVLSSTIEDYIFNE